ncbi:MAG: SnoaL-like domain-containing protein [Longimicrobiales bacterium]
MSVKDVADGLVERCRQGDFLGAVDRFYGDDIVSIEPVGSAEVPAELRGKTAVRGKNEWWDENHQVHSVDVRGPFIGDNEFAVQYNMDVTNKTNGQRMQMKEVALYEVKGDRIVREQFFYNPGASTTTE